MWTLRTTDCYPIMRSTFERGARLFGDHGGDDLQAAVWSTGKGSWKSHFPRVDQIVMLAAGPQGALKEMPCLLDLSGLKVSMAWFGSSCYDFGLSRPFCMVLRSKAAILLSAGSNLYVPSPDTSAHGIIADTAALERQFPGLFQIEA